MHNLKKTKIANIGNHFGKNLKGSNRITLLDP